MTTNKTKQNKEKKIGFLDMNKFIRSIILIAFAFSIGSIIYIGTHSNDINSIKDLPHKYCKGQFIICWYEDNPNVIPNCYMDFTSIEGYPIEMEIIHKSHCENGKCSDSYSREVCKIE